MHDYEQKLEQERRWYQPRSKPFSFFSKLLHHPLVLNPKRLELSYHFAKESMSNVLHERIHGTPVENLLIAPCGTGCDYPYVSPYADRVHGIDISDVAVSKCSPEMITSVGDILASGYPDESFDAIVSPLFFHHMRRVGFDPFLNEFWRILKKNGVLIILEPSLWYPLNVITRPIKLLNNPYNEVKDEGPFPPGQMMKSMCQAGYTDISLRAATFSHPLLPVPLSKLVHGITRPISAIWPCNIMAWMIVFSAKKGQP